MGQIGFVQQKKKCERCNTVNDASNNFCIGCSASLIEQQNVCPECFGYCPPGALFSGCCGAPLHASVPVEKTPVAIDQHDTQPLTVIRSVKLKHF